MMGRILAVLAACFLSVNPAFAQEPKEKPHAQKSQQAAAQLDKDAEEMLAAVVRVRMKAIADARSSANLGQSREGTGVVIDERGHIVTIGYIVIEADSIEITTQDDRTVPATLVGYDHASGFGLLLDSAIFTAPPASQWAGAALVSREGKLVGIGSLLVRETLEGDSQVPGNMFVPIDLLKPILADLIEKGRRKEPPRPWLGLATEEMHGHLLVTRVSPEGPADRAGVRNGDVVVGVGADPVKSQEELYRKVWALGAAGIDVPLRILKGADVRELRLRSIDRFQYFREKPTY